MGHELLPLDMLAAGEEADVADVSGDPAWVHRLAELGIQAGCRLRMQSPTVREELQPRQQVLTARGCIGLVTLATLATGGITGRVTDRDNTSGVSGPARASCVVIRILCASPVPSLPWQAVAAPSTPRGGNVGSSGLQTSVVNCEWTDACSKESRAA